MRIAYVIPQLNFGGAQTMLVRLVKKINKTKCDVQVFVCGNSLNNSIEKELEETGIRCHFLNMNDEGHGIEKIKNKIASYQKFKQTLNDYNPDIVHDHLDNFYSFIYCILNHKKLVFTIHSWPDRLATRRMKTYLKLLNSRNDINLVGVAKAVTNRTEKVLLADWDALSTIYNPIELNNYYHEEKDKSTFDYIHIGRLTPIKNQKMLLQAFAVVKKECEHSRLIIAGDGELRNRLEIIAQELNILDSVSFLGNRSDIPKLLSQSDVFVLASNSEACPVTVIEAMASGVAVVATNVGAIAEQIGTDKMLSKKEDVNALATNLILIQKSESLRKEIVAIQNERVIEFDADSVAVQHERLYEKVLSRKM